MGDALVLISTVFLHLPARVGPGAKLEVTLLVVEGKPGDVDLARRLRRESYEHIHMILFFTF